jgi:hypothetical protein
MFAGASANKAESKGRALPSITISLAEYLDQKRNDLNRNDRLSIVSITSVKRSS